jgi:hypothetical protein
VVYIYIHMLLLITICIFVHRRILLSAICIVFCPSLSHSSAFQTTEVHVSGMIGMQISKTFTITLI